MICRQVVASRLFRAFSAFSGGRGLPSVASQTHTVAYPRTKLPVFLWYSSLQTLRTPRTWHTPGLSPTTMHNISSNLSLPANSHDAECVGLDLGLPAGDGAVSARESPLEVRGGRFKPSDSPGAGGTVFSPLQSPSALKTVAIMSPLKPRSPSSIYWDGSPTLSALSPINHLLFFTPTGIGSTAPSPTTDSSPIFSATVSIESAIPSAPPSPFIFPGTLIGFPGRSEPPPALTEGTSPHVLIDPAYTGVGSKPPSLQGSSEPPLLFQPHSPRCEPAVQNRCSVAGLFLGALKGPALPSDSASRQPLDGFANQDATAADIVEQVQALGDQAIEDLNALQDSPLLKVSSFIYCYSTKSILIRGCHWSESPFKSTPTDIGDVI